MYPYLHDFFNDVFGLDWRLPFPMFGFWVAMAFIAAHYIFSLELKRKEALGLMDVQIRKQMVGEKMSFYEALSQGIMGFILGFKGLYAITDYDLFVADPPGFLFSTQGSFFGGLMAAVVLIYLKYREKKKEERDPPEEITIALHPYELVGNMTIIAAIAGILGAKLFHNLENLHEFMEDPVDALLSFSGLSIYGGLIVGGISVVYYAYKNKLRPVHVIDACAPALILAYGVGRIGCQLSGDGDWGIPNDSPMPEFISFLPEWVWAYDYPNNVLGIDLKRDFAQMGMYSESGRAWPTPLYESILSFVIFIFLWLIRKKINLPGVMFSIYIILAGTERFFIEKIRINPPYSLLGMEATQAEIISVVLVLTGLLGIYWSYRRPRI